ncbi:MAG: phospholipase D family protein [Psychromonas sp.]
MFKRVICCLFIYQLMACASLPENTSTKNYSLPQPEDSELVNQVLKKHQQIDLQDDEISMLLLDEGIDAFVARLSLINAAESSIDLQYYLYHSDLSGALLTSALWNAAERGVRVRLLVDDMDLDGKDYDIARLSSHPNFEVRIFNPFIRGKGRTSQYVTQLGSITRRMHNKSFTIDHSISILGGRNIGDEYFGASTDVTFGDLDVLISGVAVEQVAESFDLYWNNQLSYPVELLIDFEATDMTLSEVSEEIEVYLETNQNQPYIKLLKNNELIELVKKNEIKKYSGQAIILYDDPLKITKSRDKTEYHLAPKLKPFMDSVQNEIIIVSPYFVPGKEGIEFFEELITRGVTVKILTNSLKSNDVAIVHAGYSNYRKQLLKMGVQLYEMDSKLLLHADPNYKKVKNKIGSSKASLHAKYFILDRHYTFIGSLNLDPRSFNENTEIGVIVDSDELAIDLAESFDKNVPNIAFKLSLKDNDIVWDKVINNKKTTLYKEPYSSWWDRLMNGFMGILPVESEL